MNFILDTSFVAFGKSSLKINVENNILEFSRSKYHKFFIVPDIINELQAITRTSLSETIQNKFIIETVNLYESKISAKLVCCFLDSLKSRNKKLLENTELLINSEKPNDQKVGKLRHLFRETLYSGILDSSTDIELCLLARKKRGTLLTRDDGLAKFASEIGVRVSDKINMPV
jgi:predicted DNA-binding protein (UPF0278 family)